MPDKECIESTVIYNKCESSFEYQESIDGKSIVILSN